MADYAELVKALRNDNACLSVRTAHEAADAIEQLQKSTCPYYIRNVHDSGDDSLCDKYKCEANALPRWIPVTERLPKDNEAVVITWVNHNPVFYYQHIKDKPQTATGVYYKCQWYWWSAVVQDYLAEYGKWDVDKMDDAIEVTHWMPLPEPPKEGSE